MTQSPGSHRAKKRSAASARRATLVMLSGGIDSTYTLAKLLRESDDEIFAHHIHLVNKEKRFRVEAERCREIVSYCKSKYRNVNYTESLVDHRGFPFFGYDVVTVGFEAGIVAQSFFAERGRMIDRWTIGSCREEGHWEERFRHVLACCAANCFPNTPPQFFLLPLVPKALEMEYLGADLLQLTWSCREPVPGIGGFQPCGDCKTCIDLSAAREEMQSHI